MHELRSIVVEAARCRERGTTAVLATLVAVRGSHYRRPGARMLLAGGELSGVLSGGCLEGDLAARAERVAASGLPEVATYDLTRVGEELWGFGLGCAGVVSILLEALRSDRDHGSLAFLEDCLARRERGALATLYASGSPADRDRSPTDVPRLGSWLALAANGERRGDLAPALAERLIPALQAALTGAPARGLDLDGEHDGVSLLVEPIEPPASFVLCGAGRDTVPMAEAARAVGWEVTLVDLQDLAATPERFPVVAHRLGAPVRGLAARLALAPRAALVVATHRYLDDLALLEELAPLPFGYLGLLGPRARRERLLADLAARGVVVDDALRARLRGPAGLDLGSAAPEEIALAVIAEAMAALAGRSAAALSALADAVAATSAAAVSS